eukprot:s1854_g9.t1
MRRTALENGLADRFTISESFVSTNYTCPGVLRVGFAHEFVDQDELKQVDASHVVQHDCQTATLADILNKWSNATVDLLRIHVDGLEMDVLRSAAENLHKIQTLAISMWTYRDFPQAYDPVAIIQLLLDSGCTTTLYYLFVRPRKRTRPEMKELHNQEAVSALTKSQVMTLDTMTLMAFCGFQDGAISNREAEEHLISLRKLRDRMHIIAKIMKTSGVLGRGAFFARLTECYNSEAVQLEIRKAFEQCSKGGVCFWIYWVLRFLDVSFASYLHGHASATT